MNKKIKKLEMVIVLLVFVIAVAGCTGSEGIQQSSNMPEKVREVKEESVVDEGEKKEEAKKEVEEEISVEPFEIGVTSQIVKKIDKKHRYFFDIRNNDSKDFDGEVTISLYNDSQNSALGRDTFNTTSSMAPKLGTSVYLDINTAPTSIHGEYGITKFKYEVKVDGRVVKIGGRRDNG